MEVARNEKLNLDPTAGACVETAGTRDYLPALYFGVFLALLLIAMYTVLLWDRSFYTQDHTYYFEPLSRFIGEHLGKGQLPLWNRFLYCGMPQIAIPSPGIFYPPNIVFAFLPYTQAIATQMILHQVIAGVGGLLLINSLRWGLAPALASGVIFALCGYMSSLTSNYTLVATASYIPFCLWSFRCIMASGANALRRQRLYRDTTIAAIAVYLMITAGRPEISVAGMSLIGAVIALTTIYGYKTKFATSAVLKQISFPCVALLIGVCLSMPTVLPALEWALRSPRAHGLNLSQVLMWSTNWYDFLSMIFARPFGDLQILGAPYLPLVCTRPLFMPFVPSTFIGPVALTLAIWGMFDRSWWWRHLIIIMLAFLIIFVLGEYTPVMPWLIEKLPMLAVFRYPIKLLILVTLCIAVLAARGFLVFDKSLIDRGTQRLTLLLWSLFLVVAVIFFGYWWFGKVLVLPKLTLEAKALYLLARSMSIGSLLGLVACLVYLLKEHGRLSRTNGKIIMLLLLGASLAVANISCFQSVTRADYFEHKSYLAKELNALSGTRNGRVQRDPTAAGRVLNLYFDPLWMPPSDRSFSTASPTVSFFQYGRDLLLTNSNIDSNIEETFGYEGAEEEQYRSTFLNVLNHSSQACTSQKAGAVTNIPLHGSSDLPLAKFCRLTATSWVCTQVYKEKLEVPKLDQTAFPMVREDRSMNVRVYAVKQTLPRAYASHLWTWGKEHSTVIDQITSNDGDFRPEIFTIIEPNYTVKDNNTKSEQRPFAPLLPSPPAIPPLQWNFDRKNGNAAEQSVASIVGALQRGALQCGALYAERSVYTAEETKTGSRWSGYNEFIQPAQFLQNTNEHVAISVKVKKPCFVVLADHNYPGWNAFVDSVPQPTYRANGFMRAVYVPEGAHLIEFNYEPESLKWGYIIAVFSIAVLVIFLFMALAPTVRQLLKHMTGQKP